MQSVAEPHIGTLRGNMIWNMLEVSKSGKSYMDLVSRNRVWTVGGNRNRPLNTVKLLHISGERTSRNDNSQSRTGVCDTRPRLRQGPDRTVLPGVVQVPTQSL